MSQSRSRKAQTFGGENSSKARSSVNKESGDATNSVHHQNQPKTKHNSRTKNKIPKSIRYDLDNALVSLCDVWFDDIKPHLVRNKIKLHVDNSGAGTSASGDCRRMRTSAPGCSHHDPGSGSDRRQLKPANFVAFSPTPPTASKVRFVRQPTARPPSPIHSRPAATTQNKNIKMKSRKEVQPQSTTSPVVGRPRLCHSCQPSYLSPRTKKRRVHTAPSLHTRDSILSHVAVQNEVIKKHKKTQTNITWVHYQSKYYATVVNPVSYTVLPINTNVSTLKNKKPRVQQRQRWKNKSPHSEIPKMLTTECPLKNKLTSTTIRSSNHRPTSPEVLKKLTKGVPVQTVTIALPRSSREKRPNTNTVKCKKQTGERKVDPSIAPQSHDTEHLSNSQFGRCFATTNFNQAKSKECVKNRKITDTDCNVIYDQDLIDIIGTKNDKRLRILYHSPMREESNSVLNLLPSPNQRIQKARSKGKNLPWR